ncbi:hypothetical protein Syun_019329 [Stephania yunnanensis]|uniref:Uncharacterized protein n=1 Tax=Stephania yunnanensis TaxID=152371 RepID=A0AAP0IVY3_9MAGN
MPCPTCNLTDAEESVEIGGPAGDIGKATSNVDGDEEVNAFETPTAPEVGMAFDASDNVKIFFEAYDKSIGFTIKVQSTDKRKDGLVWKYIFTAKVLNREEAYTLYDVQHLLRLSGCENVIFKMYNVVMGNHANPSTIRHEPLEERRQACALKEGQEEDKVLFLENNKALKNMSTMLVAHHKFLEEDLKEVKLVAQQKRRSCP